MYRVEILDFLRGWASVLVVISHLIGVFWTGQSGLEHLMGYKNIGPVYLPYAEWIIENKLFFGQLGVAIFFILSGYVITLSLEKYNSWGFLVNRIIRIYPVYIVGILLVVLGLNIVDFDNDGIPYSAKHLVIHSLIVVRQWLNYQVIDGISWTLEIELYFYIIMFVFFRFNNKSRNIIIFIFLISVFFTILSTKLNWYEKRQLLMIGYMFIGYANYYQKHRNMTPLISIVLYLSIMFIMYLLYRNTIPFSNNVLKWYIPYAIAPILFYLAIFHFMQYKIDNISKFFAKISYPLYVVHPIFGYALMVFFLKNGFSSWFSLIVTLIIVLILSYIVHIFIEKPTLKYAKKFNRDLQP